MCEPTLSHNAPTHNLLLKIIVPKRTGRKRKRGTQEPYEMDHAALPSQTSSECPVGNANPSELLRDMRENEERYKVEVTATIDQTHRFRGTTNIDS